MQASALAISSCICMKVGERRFRAAEAFRQQRAVEAVVDQRGDDRLGQPARAFDLVGLAQIRGASARARSTRSRAAALFMPRAS